MKFTSQIATTRKQSERLIALGVDVRTADCRAFDTIKGLVYKSEFDHNLYSELGRGGNCFPAWSLHRLIEMAETRLRFWPSGMVEEDELEKYYNKGNYFDNIIDLIARLIEDRCFNEEYLNK
jgi:hypothetical protein